MAWPKGVPRPTPTSKLNPQEDGSVEIQTDKSLEEIAQTTTTVSQRKVSLKNRQEDPATKWKTDEDHYTYRWLNKNPRNMSEREAEGWEVCPSLEGRQPIYGDLILGRKAKGEYLAEKHQKDEKTQAQTTAAVEQFKEEAARYGVEVDDNTRIGG